MKNFPNIDEYEFDRFIHPSNIFKTPDELHMFLQIDAGITDEEYNMALEFMIELCEKDENYDYCAIIKSYLKNEKSNISGYK